MPDVTPLSSRIPTGERPLFPEAVDGVSWRAATAADIDAITALHRVADPIDHPTFGTPRGDIVELFESSWIDPALDVVVGARGDEVVAYGQATVIPGTAGFAETTLSGVVHPGHRGRGLGGALLDWQQARALEHLALVEEPVEGRMNAYTSSEQAALHRLLERRGFGVVRAFDELSRDTAEDIPEIAIPEGLELVPYSQQWSAATMAAKNETFADHWGSLPETVEHWEQRNTTAANGAGGLRTDASLLLVGRDESGADEVVAFVLTTVNEEDWERLGHPFGYITLVGVRRSQRGRGAAQALLAAVLLRYRELGWQRATLHVDTTSPTGADRLYRRIGFVPAARELVYGRTF
ncbi:GNAT family N-acetyltransferase [Naasia lichenicola]|uniref:GNAT family N-acetyltransferase n=1 Tax=Naasia lichenicola TaxID=2565933 RepID=A0A4V3WSY8_9MICO|nr:GNAT family N-acetyltransferase [Naasia lichenicola]THG29737.1 GNAT family N-acetyltransferase [Naasia lichenicola]